jgi:DNA repair protein RadD
MDQLELFGTPTETVETVTPRPAQNGFRLRPYQDDSIAAVDKEFQRGDRTLLELATGLGKTEIFVAIGDQWTNGRVLVTAPTIELVGQAAKKFYKRTGVFPAIEQADQWSNETPWARNKFVVASIASLHEKRLKAPTDNGHRRFEGIGLLVIDECHFASAENKSYQNVIQYLKELNPGIKILGVTATAKRHDQSAMALVFDTCCYQYGIRDAVDDGWLVPLEVNTIRVKSLDFSTKDADGKPLVKTSKGDFTNRSLAAVMQEEKPLHEIAAVTVKEAKGRSRTLVFVPGVDMAKKLAHII